MQHRQRVLKGQYETPLWVCDFMLIFLMDSFQKASGSASDSILRANHPTSQTKEKIRLLEPGCGSAPFLRQMQVYNQYLQRHGTSFELESHGIEIDPSRIESQLIHPDIRILEGDFLSSFVEPLAPFDFIIGNPPYVRQEHVKQSDHLDKKGLMDYLSGHYAPYLNQFPEQQRLFSQTTDLYVAFFLQAHRLLKPGGRLAFITSNSWMTTRMGMAFRQFLTHHFNILYLIESGCERWFPDAAINATILVLEKRQALREMPTEDREARYICLSEPLAELYSIHNEIPPNLALPRKGGGDLNSPLIRESDINLIKGDDMKSPPPLRGRARVGGANDIKNSDSYWSTLEKQIAQLPYKSLSLDTLHAEPAQWSFLCHASELWTQFLSGGSNLWQTLEQLGTVRYPLKTGINRFFYLTPLQAEQWGIEPEFLFPVIRSSRKVTTYRLQVKDCEALLFSCPDSLDSLRQNNKKGALAYIEWGQTQKTTLRQKQGQLVLWPEAPSLRSHRPWYFIKPLASAHLLCSRFIDQRFFFLQCEEGMMEDQTFYGLTLTDPQKTPSDFIAGLLNSTLSYGLLELFGQNSLGEGVLQFARGDMARFPVLKQECYSLAQQVAILEAYQAMVQRPILPLAEELHHPTRVNLDRLVLAPLETFLHAGQTIDSVREDLPKDLFRRVQDRIHRARSV